MLHYRFSVQYLIKSPVAALVFAWSLEEHKWAKPRCKTDMAVCFQLTDHLTPNQ